MTTQSGFACTATTLLDEHVTGVLFSEKVLGHVLADYLQA